MGVAGRVSYASSIYLRELGVQRRRQLVHTSVECGVSGGARQRPTGLVLICSRIHSREKGGTGVGLVSV